MTLPVAPMQGTWLCLLCIFRHMCGPDLTSSGRLEYCRKKGLEIWGLGPDQGCSASELLTSGARCCPGTALCTVAWRAAPLGSTHTRCPSSSDNRKYLQTCRTSPPPAPVAGQGAESPALAENHLSSVRLFVGVGKSVGGWPWGSLWTTLRSAWIESWGTVAPLPFFTEDLF